MNGQQVTMRKNGEVIISGHPADVREVIEDMMTERLGFCPSLQESICEDDGIYQVYLHTDAYEEISEEQIIQLEQLGITDHPNSIEGFMRFLQLDFVIAEQFQEVCI